MILFARDPARWAFASRYVAIGQPDKNGQFDVRSLAEGRYYAIALESVGAGEVTDPEFLRQLQTQATVVTVRDGEKTSLALQLQQAVPSPF